MAIVLWMKAECCPLSYTRDLDGAKDVDLWLYSLQQGAVGVVYHNGLSRDPMPRSPRCFPQGSAWR